MRSRQEGGIDRSYGSVNVSRSSGRNYAVQARALMKPDEVLQMSGEWLVAFLRDVEPIAARRIKWFADPMFGGRRPWRDSRIRRWMGWLFVAAIIAVCVWAAMKK